jgi:hypothetical protein
MVLLLYWQVCRGKSSFERRPSELSGAWHITVSAVDFLLLVLISGNMLMLILAVANIHDHFTKILDKFGTKEAALKHMLNHRGWAGEESAEATKTQWWAVNRLFNRTWFHRTWIVQEVFKRYLARNAQTNMC